MSSSPRLELCTSATNLIISHCSSETSIGKTRRRSNATASTYVLQPSAQTNTTLKVYNVSRIRVAITDSSHISSNCGGADTEDAQDEDTVPHINPGGYLSKHQPPVEVSRHDAEAGYDGDEESDEEDNEDNFFKTPSMNWTPPTATTTLTIYEEAESKSDPALRPARLLELAAIPEWEVPGVDFATELEKWRVARSVRDEDEETVFSDSDKENEAPGSDKENVFPDESDKENIPVERPSCTLVDSDDEDDGVFLPVHLPSIVTDVPTPLDAHFSQEDFAGDKTIVEGHSVTDLEGGDLAEFLSASFAEVLEPLAISGRKRAASNDVDLEKNDSEDGEDASLRQFKKLRLVAAC
ncbi:hypothetical protein CYLTODRAFT_490985 [Cylindrobasidium torrendii FP15055 ss-10]|uniref:Uncharacterized protein n=1 Tax=Cylindrobasidium torrendii FP15055 ss-10 TaxID=1314674 RepID=A0A0D7BA37_9AGAR|nr:hypothetical protein CYLTODRAFT_490985 [Cylindrobasidium torrendii FP15055 ss-10]